MLNRSCTPPSRNRLSYLSPDRAAAGRPLLFESEYTQRVSRRLGLFDDDSPPSTPPPTGHGMTVHRPATGTDCTPGRPSLTVSGGAALICNTVNCCPLNSHTSASAADCTTPEVRRQHGSRRLSGGATSLLPALFWTPQVDPARVALRNRVDAELDRINAVYRTYPQPPVTTLIEGQLYLGGCPDEQSIPMLRRLGVKHIVNCCAAEYRVPTQISEEFCVSEVHSFDQQDYLILHNDYEVFTHILTDILRQGERAYVHCLAGINRSVTLCSAYLMEKMLISPIDVIQLYRERGRMRILENHGFRHQLVDHHLQLSVDKANTEESWG